MSKGGRSAAAAGVVFLLGLMVIFSLAGAEEKKAVPAAKFNLARMEICKGIENNEPVGVGKTFPLSQEKVYCFLEFKDVAKDTNITYVWKQNGKEVRRMPQTIRALTKYRTWANKNFNGQKGNWSVEILGEDGKVIKVLEFKVE